ncbi:hypothetical protein AB9E14_07670 [Rhizobium leguminosarum]|uniref:hypothetical protein n=1 Tax=Rhizobium leguminosarum TaxID=384 RepID=UPI003F979017
MVDAPACVIPEFSTDKDWRNDPNRHRPLGSSWRMSSEMVEGLRAAFDLPVMETPLEREVLHGVLADSIVSAHLYPGRRVSYSRRAEYWAQRLRYTGPGWRRHVVTRVIDKLVDKGILIEHDRRPPGKRGVQSSYLPNPMLATFPMPRLNKRRGESLILKNAKGELIAYKDTQQTRDRRSMLEKVNSILSETDFRVAGNEALSDGRWMKIDDTLLSITQTAMHRVYNGGWTLGGRFYGSFWMNMPSDDRRYILIDGGETVEVDYDQLHARIIYAWAKKKLVGDAYEIAGFERKVAKRAFFIIVNARTYPSAKGAVAEYLTKKKMDPRQAGKLIAALRERHKPVAKYFHSGLGLQLQNLDSEMAEYVLRVMTVQKGIPCLPIHDSFIVPAGQVKNLMRTMKAAYERFVGRASAAVCSMRFVATYTVAESTAYRRDVPHLPSSPSASSTEAEYGIPVLDSSVLQNQESSSQNSVPSVVVETALSILLESKEEPKAEQIVVKRRPMPELMRKAMEDRQEVWREEEARKQVIRESRQRGRQLVYGGKDGSAVVQTV